MNNIIYFFVLNMDRNTERYEKIARNLRELNCKYSRIKAIDGQTMENDEECKKLLKPRVEIIGQTFFNKMTNEEWIYDGTVSTSFPNCSPTKSFGTKGLTLSNIKAFRFAKEMNYQWFCILEDDANLDKEDYNKILEFAKNEENKKIDIVLLDARHFGWGGTAGILYNKKIIDQLILDLHPLSDFSIQSHLYGDSNLGNLWDWKLWKYVNYINKNFSQLPVIKSGDFPSMITD